MCYKCGTDDETYNPATGRCNSCPIPEKHTLLIEDIRANLITMWGLLLDLEMQNRLDKEGK